jgi:hypothetical protein
LGGPTLKSSAPSAVRLVTVVTSGLSLSEDGTAESAENAEVIGLASG